MSNAWSKALQGLKNLDQPVSDAAEEEVDRAPGHSAIPTPASRPVDWTPEQREVIECPDDQVRVRALAGTGKSRVLEAYARRRAGRWRYLTFNRALVQEAKRHMPTHVKVATFHGLAYARFGLPFQERFERKWQPGDLARVLGRSMPVDVERRWLQVLQATHTAFMRSDSPLILPEHVDRAGWLLARACEDPVPDDLDGVVFDAERLWQVMIQPGAALPIDHDVYLKLWCLAEVRLPVDGILIDEDQDLTPALHSWFASHPGIRVRVGDPHQGIYGFRGAAAREDQPEETVLCMPHSFRFGPAIAEQANRVLSRLGSDRLIGVGPEGTVNGNWKAGAHTTLLGRTHAGLIEAALEASDQGIAMATSVRLPERLAAVLALSRGQTDQIRNPWVAGFRDMARFEQAIRDSGDADWLAICRMVRRHGSGLERRLAHLNAQCREDGWQMSTVHAAKGQTFARVALAQDLPLVDPAHPAGKEETHLLYVAMTRAQSSLDMHPAWAEAFNRWATRAEPAPRTVDLSDSGF